MNNEEVQNILREVINENGIYEIIKPNRCLELMTKKYGGFKEEFIYTSEAIKYGVVEDIIKIKPNTKKDVLKNILITRLIVRMNIPENLAEYIINTWLYATGISNLNNNTNQKIRPSPKKIKVGKIEDNDCYDSLYYAIRDIDDGGEIEILPGVYYGHFKIKKPIKIRGVSKEKVIIQSDISPVFTVLSTEKVVFENISIQGIGKTDYDKFHTIEVINSQLSIKNCIIRGSTLSGVYIYGRRSDVRIEKCDIEQCSDSGIIVSDDAKCTIEESTLKNCLKNIITARDFSNLFLINCHIKDGKNCGIKLLNDSSLYMINSDISYNNHAGLIISYNSCSNLINSRIHHNKGYGIIVSDMSCTTIENCQVYQNSISGIRFDKNSDFFNYSSNINDTIVTISGTRDYNQDESVKSETIEEYIKNPPDTSMENPPNTLQSIVVLISFILIFEILTLLFIEIKQLIFFQADINYHLLFTVAFFLGIVAGLTYIIKRS